MSTEQLTCTVCDQQWERTRTRGRKPTRCPECAGTTKKVAKPTPKTNAADNAVEPELVNALLEPLVTPQYTVEVSGEPQRIGSTLSYPEFSVDGVDYKPKQRVRLSNRRGEFEVVDFMYRPDGKHYVTCIAGGKFYLANPSQLRKRK